MQRKRGELGLIGDALADLDGPVKALREAPPQALHHFTQADQVNQLVSASEADPDLGFMARLLALCSLPRSNPGNRLQYKRVNGPYTLIMYSSGEYKLPFGNLPRLLLAWVCTEAVRTQSRELVLGRSLSKFMRALGIKSDSGGARGEYTRLRNQMKRLFGVYAKYLDKAFNSADLNRERKKQLHRIAELRHRHVLVIAADVQNRLAGLSNEDLLAIRDQLSNVDGGDAIDLILETPGGSGEAAEDIVRLVRDRFSSMGVIVPGTAKSAGTILTMAGDEILMSDESGLGPIDAQITQKGKVFSAHALLQGMNRIKQEIEETGNLNRIYIPMLQNLSPGELQHARNVQDFAVELVRKWLVSYKFKDWTMHRTSGEIVTEKEKHDRANEIATALSDHSRWKTHGRSINISDLHKLGLRITNFGENHKLADAIRRYYILLRMTFESNIFKLFETPKSQIIRFEHVKIEKAPVPTPGKVHQVIAAITCKNCNTVMKVQGNLGGQSPLLPGHLSFPANNKLQCPACGVVHDLVQSRQQIEAQSKKPLLTPPELKGDTLNAR